MTATTAAELAKMRLVQLVLGLEQVVENLHGVRGQEDAVERRYGVTRLRGV
ncbi:hypothetical protein JG687_00016123 [Phytophthora cactorum]|uniref:Uncharacterized protein n=1 Tax=Phytophthora cactorum TaxID=29920 RepID=A0A329S8H1_9STRA|nr:hypothetical protein Pcac1_g16870 [Phytophthora cactorum]KAG2840036.1 hypothetical protein PC112_g3865 [Phytophthora cactorum]KAG2840646.1 hypothetical protein PC111_g3410 [Phytophthora cactorum]KAG2866252.1 hypothetical protein PC113_g2994 [Phytophthora cactorum]KAG2929458.1 hypothetical protein PC114_g2845 [Phytophthora cactorum]